MNKEVKSIVIEISFIVLLLVICVPIFVSASSNYNNSLEKISNDDIIITNMEHNSFGLYALKYFKTTDEWEAYNWLHHYQDAFFDVSLNVNLRSSYLLVNTAEES